MVGGGKGEQGKAKAPAIVGGGKGGSAIVGGKPSSIVGGKGKGKGPIVGGMPTDVRLTESGPDAHMKMKWPGMPEQVVTAKTLKHEPWPKYRDWFDRRAKLWDKVEGLEKELAETAIVSAVK